MRKSRRNDELVERGYQALRAATGSITQALAEAGWTLDSEGGNGVRHAVRDYTQPTTGARLSVDVEWWDAVESNLAVVDGAVPDQ